MKTHWGLVAVAGMCLVLAAPSMADVFSMGPGLTSLEFVPPVGNPGNPGESSGYYESNAICGGVAYEYLIAKYEVTAAQYTEFLNAVADDDTYGLYSASMVTAQGCQIVQAGSSGSYTYSVAADWANRPVNFVNWGDAARFANWVHNGQPTGAQDLTTTEDGAYFLNGAMTNPELMAVTREPDATYFIPTDNEWYKAAYHKNDGPTGNYWDYATGTDTLPSNLVVNPDPGNNATYNNSLGAPYYRTEVGEHENSVSPYGTFDQTGNVMEWTETDLIIYNYFFWKVLRGGAYNSSALGIPAMTRTASDPSLDNMTYGFRLAGAGGAPAPPHIQALEVFYNGKYADAADPAKSFLAVGEASSMSLIGDDLHGNVTNYSQGTTGIRVTFDTVVAFSGGAAAAFSYEATPEQSADTTFTAFTPPTAPVYVVDDSSGKTVVTITFTDGEIKNRWLKTIIDASQVSANTADLDGEMTAPLTFPSGDGTAGGNAEFIIGNRLGDVDANYRCLLNDAISIRNKVSGTLVGISNTFDIDKNQRILLNEAIGARNVVSGTALPALP